VITARLNKPTKCLMYNIYGMSNISDILKEAKSKGYYADEYGKIYSAKKLISLRNRDNRLNFTIRYYGKRVTIAVHKYVAYLKYGDKIFDDGIEVRHLNGNSLDNSYENILIGTHSDNMLDIPKNVRIKKAISASSKNRKFGDDIIKNIMNDKNNGMSYSKLCEKYNTSKSTLSYLFNNAYYSGARNIE